LVYNSCNKISINIEKYASESPFSQLSDEILICGKISIFGKDIVDLQEGSH
jgi:hypothetical protein